MSTVCRWCVDPYEDRADPEELCPDHRAEYDGESVAGAERREAIEYRDWFDSTYG